MLSEALRHINQWFFVVKIIPNKTACTGSCFFQMTFENLQGHRTGDADKPSKSPPHRNRRALQNTNKKSLSNVMGEVPKTISMTVA